VQLTIKIVAVFLLFVLAVPVAHARPGSRGHGNKPGTDAPAPAGPGHVGPDHVGPGGKPNIVGDNDDDNDGGSSSDGKECSDTDLNLPNCLD